MATLNANALTSLERAKDEIGIDTTDYDDDITQYINVTSDQIELDCNRVFREVSYTHRFTGKGDQLLVMAQFPATVLTSVKVDNKWVFDASSSLTVPTEATFDNEIFLIRRGACNYWPRGEPLNIQVEYTAGYATIPDGIQQACIEYVRLLYQSTSDRRIGRTSKSKGGEGGSWDTSGMPYIVSTLIAPYRREAAVARAFSLKGYDIPRGNERSKQPVGADGTAQ